MSWHYTVDDHSIYQHLPDGERAYHAGAGGSGPGNATSIGIEICVDASGNFEQAKANAAALVRLLMAKHGIPLDRVVQHNHWNGRTAPRRSGPQRAPGRRSWASAAARCPRARTRSWRPLWTLWRSQG